MALANDLAAPTAQLSGATVEIAADALAPTPDRLAMALERFRERRPHVHCITNAVAQEFTANVLLAAGATPSMTIAPEEVTNFVGYADALLVNLGTLDMERREAASTAIRACRAERKPWVLDPVFVHASRPRLNLARTLLEREPTLVRANAKERAALFNGEAKRIGTVVCVSGEVDRIIYRDRALKVHNGSPMLRYVTAAGCALTAVAAGFLAANEDRLAAAAGACALFGIAAERAAEASAGPGTFATALLDALAATGPDELARSVKLS